MPTIRTLIEYPPPFRLRGRFDPLLAGTTGLAFIRFRDGVSGKVRPVVVISRDETHLYVRPIFSRPYVYAGGRLATFLTGLPAAGLRRAGYVSPDVVRIPETGLIPLGRLNWSDWNTLRLGLSQAESAQ